MVSCKSSKIVWRYVRCHIRTHYIEKAQFSVQFVIWDMCGVHTDFGTLVYTEFYVFDYLYLTEAPPLRLVKYTEKQVLDKIEALEDDLYSEVLTLTREEKDEQRE